MGPLLGREDEKSRREAGTDGPQPFGSGFGLGLGGLADSSRVGIFLRAGHLRQAQELRPWWPPGLRRHGGAVLSVHCCSARSIKFFSMFYEEQEALLFPSFKAVTKE